MNMFEWNAMNKPISLSIGDRVTVNGSNYTQDLRGLQGTIKDMYYGSSKYAVLLDTKSNPRSQHGYFYFYAQQLTLIQKGNKDMSTIMEGNYKIADVSFIEGKNTSEVYAYALYDEGIVMNDIVVVKTANHGFSLAKVIRVRPKDDSELTREVVCLADFTDYENRLDARAKRKKLMDEMRLRAEKLQEIALYKTLAAADPEMAALLHDYESIG